jgi:hypothetical protein
VHFSDFSSFRCAKYFCLRCGSVLCIAISQSVGSAWACVREEIFELRSWPFFVFVVVVVVVVVVDWVKLVP